MRSMTGFGHAQAELDGLTVRVDARSVNNRFLKLNIRLPDDLQGRQVQLESVVRASLSRGTVSVAVRRRGVLTQEAACQVNPEVAQGYRRQLAVLASEGEAIPLSLLVNLPGVLVQAGGDEQSEDRIGQLLVDLTEQAIQELVVMRKAEGQHIAASLGEVLDAVADLIVRVEAGLPAMLETYRQRLTQRMNDLLADSGLTVEPEAVVREVALFAERSDITEEIARLRSHLEQFKGALGRDDPVGRQLEFLVQEMFREANTMGSKVGGVEIARDVLELKGQVDRLKEQVLNVE